MIVDDEPDSRFILRHLIRLSAPTCAVDQFDDGKDGIAHLAKTLAENSALLPDLLLVDLHMPRVGGIEVLRWISQQPALASLIKVVVSSSDLPVDVSEARAAGADSFLTKFPSTETFRALFAATVLVAKARAARAAEGRGGRGPTLVSMFPQGWPEEHWRLRELRA